MWVFQSFRDSVQNHASGLLRNLTDRDGGEDEQEHDAGTCHRNAMQNVVTPKSIPKFTLPPLLNQDVVQDPPNDQDYQNGYTRQSNYTTAIEHSKTSSFDSHIAFDNLQITHWDPDASNDEIDAAKDQPSLRTRKFGGSNSSLSIKNLIQRKRSDGKDTTQTIGRERSQRGTDTPRENTKFGEARGKEREQLGMSLQHLVATKSGFPILSESPNTRRKESLFFALETTQEMQPKRDTRSRSPGSDGNNSSSRSSPRESPAPSPRRNPFSKSERRRTFNQSLRVDAGPYRRSSFNEEINPFCASDSDDKPVSNLTTRRLSMSEQDVSKKVDTVAAPSIRLCVTYLVKHRRLNVSILEGRNFIPRHSVYLKVTLLPRHDRGQRTDPIKIEDANPSIRERLTFDSVEEDDIPHMSLKICCKEKSSRLRHADIIGECILALCDIDFKTPNDIWISFNPYEEEEAPHIQLSLCYDAMLGCLTVDVVAARNVPKGSLGRQPDCFVTLTEILPNAKIAKKQTKIIHRTRDPVFHESFLFSLCTDAQTPDQLVIIATLYVKDRVRGATEAVGEALLGQLVDNWPGRSQWAQALANEGEAVTHWHPLIASNA